jgi:hypothetical protein
LIGSKTSEQAGAVRAARGRVLGRPKDSAKAHQTDGVVPWSVMRRWADPKTIRRRASALHSVGLCHPQTPGNLPADAFIVSAYLRHNRPAADVAELSRKRRSAGMLGVEARAARRTNLVPPEPTKLLPLARSIEVEVETKEPNLNPLPKTGRDPAGETDGDLATQLLERLGYQRQAVDSGLRRYVERCLAHGWTPVQLGELADDIAGRSDVAEPRQYLLAALKQRANSEPTTPTAEPWADAWADVRRIAAQGSHSYSQAQGLSADAARAANEVRQVIRYESEHVARMAFRTAYMGRNGHRSAA